MSDIESGLKEAVELARSGAGDPQRYGMVRGDGYDTPLAYARAPVGQENRPPLTAPQVIETLIALSKQAYAIEALTYELSDALAGAAGEVEVSHASGGEEPSMSVFDRMGVVLLDLTRSLEKIERETRRSLGAVKP